MKNEISGRKTVLLVDDEEHILTTYMLSFQGSGLNDVKTISDSRDVLPLLAAEPIAVIVLDLNMPHLTGLDLLPKIVINYPYIPVILVTANDEIDTVVACMKAGSFDYLVKPVDSSRLVTSVKRALELSDMSCELHSLKKCLFTDELTNPEVFEPIITGSKKMRTIFQYAEVVARTRQPVMITGETGTGKELMARAIHQLSGRKGEMVALNVAGLDDAMFSDTLFGHKKGAFTGAELAREGMIARAAGGTLFLDEIGDLNEASQIKLLRLLQEQEYYPVGSDAIRKSDARIILATNRDLQSLIAAGKFRKDLYYRLCTHQIEIPPLRERLDDIPLLLDHFLTAAAIEFNKKKPTPPNELVILLQLYSFQGNIRELEALVFDAVARHTSGILSMESFRKVTGNEQPTLQSSSPAVAGEKSLSVFFGHFPNVHEVEDYMINEAMQLTKGNQGMAASLLGMSRQTLNNRLKVAGRTE
jgi:DNA-binding NtrC family response regulator